MDIQDLTTYTNNITRVEVIWDEGRLYTNWYKENKVRIDLQDNGRTLKVFITKKIKDENYWTNQRKNWCSTD